MTDQPSIAAPTALDEILRRGAALAEAGNAAAAEPLFREAVALAPEDPNVLFNLGLALATLKKFDEAEHVLRKAIDRGARGNAQIVLGELYEEQARFSEAAACFQELLRSDDRKFQLLLKIGDLHGRAGNATDQREAYRLALLERPDDKQAVYRFTQATIRAADKLSKANIEAAVQMEEELLSLVGHTPRARMGALQQLVVHKEWLERIRHGEAPYHASNVDELFFRHAQGLVEDLKKTSEEVAAGNPTDTDAQISLASALFCLGDRHGAEALMRPVAGVVSGGLWEATRFTPEFYDELRRFSDDDLVRGLPEVVEIASMPGNPTGIAYLSCNFSYFIAFALPMVVSLRDRSPTTPVHLHVMDPPPELTEFIVRIMRVLAPLTFAVTIERPGLVEAEPMEARCYYHAVRLIRFHDHLRKYGSPLWLMDVDALINRDLSALFRRLPAHDVAVRVRPARIEPWNQFNACMVGANTTPGSLAYFREIAAYIAYFHQRKLLRWGIDQLAMYSVFADGQDRGHAPTLTMLGEGDVDYGYVDSGFVWPNSGGGKMSHMKRIQTPGAPPLSPATTRFDEVFEPYWQEAVRVASTAGLKI